jgi:chemotaxis protein MotB
MRTKRALLSLSLLALAPMTMIGCANEKRDLEAELAALERENMELRSREQQLEDALNSTESRSSDLNAQLQRLRDENAQLRERMAQRPEPSARTGFEGIEGTTTSRRGGDIVVDVAGDVLFASGSTTLRNSAKQSLDRIAGVLNSRYSGNEIRIAGHTDTDPIRKSKWGTNERLSAERAHAVEQYLASRGVDKGRMHIAGYGPDKPRGSKSQSRRVEIIVLGN